MEYISRKRRAAQPRTGRASERAAGGVNAVQISRMHLVQTCKKIMIFDLKDQDLIIDPDLLHDLDQFNDLLN